MCRVHFVNINLHMTWIENSSFQIAELLLSVFVCVFFSLCVLVCVINKAEKLITVADQEDSVQGSPFF